MRLVKICCIFFCVALISLVVFRLPLLDKLIYTALVKAGAENVEVHVASAGLSENTLQKLQATLTLPTGETITATLNDVTLHCPAAQLFTSGKCETLTVSNMLIERRAQKSPRKRPLHLPEKIAFLPNPLRRKIPLQKLYIHQLQLIGDWPEHLIGKTIDADAEVNDTDLQLNASIQLPAGNNIHAQLKSYDPQHVILELAGMQQGHVFLQTTLELAPDTLTGVTTMQLAPVRKILLQEKMQVPLPDLNGQLSADITLPFPLSTNSTLHAEVKLDDTRNHHLHLTADGNPIADKLRIALNGKAGQEFINTEITVTNKQAVGSYRINAGRLQNFIRPYLPGSVPEITGNFSGEFTFPFGSAAEHSFSLTTHAEKVDILNYTSATMTVQATGTRTTQGINLDSESTLDATGLSFGKYRAAAMHLGLGCSFLKEQQHVTFSLPKQQKIQLQHFSFGNTAIDTVNATTKTPLRFSIHKEKEHKSWTIDPLRLSIAPMHITQQRRSYALDSVILTIPGLANTGSQVKMAAHMTTSGATYTDPTRLIPLNNLEADISLQKSIFKSTIYLSPATIPGRIKLIISHDLDKSRGSLHLRSTQRFNLDNTGITLAQLYTPWTLPFTLDKGKISFTAKGSWAARKPFKLSGFITVKDGDGVYKNFLFKGMNIRQDIAILPRLYSHSKGSFSVQHLIGGIDIYNVHAKLNFARSKKGHKPLIKITDFAASIFEGNISCPAVFYDQNSPDTSFITTLQGLNLEKIIPLIKMKDLQVTGKISGNLPVRLKGKDITITKGVLINDPPGGEIHYTPANIHSNGMTGYALKAIENFQYNSLKATAKYLPSGHLDLDISLQGTSPSLETTRPVHFNIHAEQNLPALLQSLRFSKGITDELDKRVKDHYK